MGYELHHAIIVTSWDMDTIKKAHAKALDIFPNTSPLMPGVSNNYLSFFIPPDGSKEGWPPSEIGDVARAKFIEHLGTYEYEDGSSPLDWVCVSYSPDDLESKIVQDQYSQSSNKPPKGPSDV